LIPDDLELQQDPEACMGAKLRCIVYVALVLVAVLFVGYPFITPRPADVRNNGYTTAVFELKDWGETLHSGTISTTDTSIINRLADVLSTGRSDADCRCASLAVVTLSRPEGEPFVFAVMPSHTQQDCQVRIGSARFAVDRQRFLAAVAPLGLPVERWTGP
jgi:hypothetical protein